MFVTKTKCAVWWTERWRVSDGYVAINNAGTEGTPGPITEQSPESYAATFDTNVLGVLLSLKHELRVMSAQKSGNIINISSTFGRIGGAGASLYVASKHAVEGLTKSAALEGAPFGVRVNVVAPGPVEFDPTEPDFLTIRSLAGDHFKKLFRKVTVYRPADKKGFRGKVNGLLTPKAARQLLELCSSESEPKIVWKARQK